LSWEPHVVRGECRFRIEHREIDTTSLIFISPDVATRPECLAEFLNPADLRYGYPFLNYTNCGPRLTIIAGAPYDRPRTSMASFAMCPACRAEYEDPTDRRFHAQPTACPACGPRLELRGAGGEPVESEDALADFVAALHSGAIEALKGLGGYHLTCDVRSLSSISELRRRKHRDEMPFAVMVQDVAAAEALCEMGDVERVLLLSPRRPIVLLRKRPLTSNSSPTRGKGVAEAVAPPNPWLGVMLPYTPLHHLLLQAAGGMPLVMTSGNCPSLPRSHRDYRLRAAGLARGCAARAPPRSRPGGGGQPVRPRGTSRG
jgi:hydrogenase maturation protein HypF